MGNKPTLEPITVGGWYEHTDGTVGKYMWNGGFLRCVKVVESWPKIKEYEAEIDRQINEALREPCRDTAGAHVAAMRTIHPH